MESDKRRERQNPPLDPVIGGRDDDDEVIIYCPEPHRVGPRRSTLVALAVAVLLIAFGQYLQYRTDSRLTELEAYVASAKELRDEQNVEVNERINEAACSFLDRLPAGPLWDPMRELYGCGPGIPQEIWDEASTAVTAEEFYDAFPATRAQDEASP